MVFALALAGLAVSCRAEDETCWGDTCLGEITDLMRAAMKGDLDALQEHLAGQPALNAMDEMGYTALAWAVRGGNTACVKALIAAGRSSRVCAPAVRAGAQGSRRVASRSRYAPHWSPPCPPTPPSLRRRGRRGC